MTEHTKDKLAGALLDIGLAGMADKAITGWYHDFMSPLDAPQITLIGDLAVAAVEHPEAKDAIMALRKRVIDGDFDATEEESEAWAQSPAGQETMRRLKQ